MRWLLLVPGALLPQAMVAEMGRALSAPLLAGRLRAGRAAGAERCAQRHAGDAHGAWLAREFGIGGDPPAAAPYAWRGLAAEGEAPPAWCARCDPLHLVVARDHLRLAALDAPLAAADAGELLALANDAAAAHSGAGGLPGLRFRAAHGQWFLHADAPLDFQAAALDAVLGRPLQARLPGGGHARALRVLANEIQMAWHASTANAAREARSELPAGALWIHEGGAWSELPARGLARVAAPDSARAAALLRGVGAAGAARPAAGRAPLSMAIYSGLQVARAQQAWDDWLARLSDLEAFVEAEAAEARGGGAAELELALGGEREVRRYALPLAAPTSPLSAISAWARRLPLARTAAAPSLAEALLEADAIDTAPADTEPAR